MRNWSLLLLPALSCLSACTPSGTPLQEKGDNLHAKGFTITTADYGKKLVARNPWANAANVEIAFYLIPRDRAVPDSLAGKNVIRVPVERVICLSTSHIAFLEALGETEKITGISGAPYISNPAILRNISAGKIADVGYGQQLNYEEILRQSPSMVMSYGVDSEIAGFLDKFRDLGIPAVMIAEYLEETPLGKAEWIKFIAEFFDSRKLADSIFTVVGQRYQDLVRKVSPLKERPVVMVGLPYREAWWIPGGNSYLAALIKDAGGTYPTGGNTSHESFVISMEEALLRASEADVWIHTGSLSSKEEILAMDSRFSHFPIMEEGEIFNNNRRSTPGGGNDFWESGTLFQDRILEDLIRIFHPGLLPGDSLTYYRKIE